MLISFSCLPSVKCLQAPKPRLRGTASPDRSLPKRNSALDTRDRGFLLLEPSSNYAELLNKQIGNLCCKEGPRRRAYRVLAVYHKDLPSRCPRIQKGGRLFRGQCRRLRFQ